ncbi:hypothetical protein B0H10DRAFT_1865144 [Mycena sp. CBHHK59/15]|nr:hypothetical protein B0H10DRAFT_1865144 [Mycena sp. CBHHK59/15]
MTAHKSQGKTLTHTIINLQDCSGTESPYVMISRVTSLDGLLILKGFSKAKISCRQSEECRDEARRHEYLALQTIIRTGSAADAAAAEADLRQLFGSNNNKSETSAVQDENQNNEDPYVRLVRKEKANAVIIRAKNAPVTVQVASGNLPRPVKRVARKSTALSGVLPFCALHSH